ncbi:MAG: right-handed parallel beta-helix repeat-containing protein, partial [Limisphaerales bacterium]
GCTLRNIGGWAVSVSGANSGVTGCDIYATGDGGISLNGGDRKTLAPAGLGAENNHIHHWSRWNRMYRPAITVTGVGNRVAHNLLENSPHTAIGFGGNDHVIEFNEIHSVCHESNDAGAIYAGRDWTMRGTVIRYNFLHHISGFEGRGCVGVYLDDMYSGTSIHGNVFHDVTRAAFVGGGHDNLIENNIFTDCKPAVHVDARALGWAHETSDNWLKEQRDKGTLSGIRYDQPPYSERYPKLPHIIQQDSAAPTGTIIARNICQGGKWDEVEKKAQPFVTFQDNLLNADPHFLDAANGNFQLRDDSPAYALGFKRIPIEKIGLYKDSDRASWPVKHSVRLKGEPSARPHPTK